MNEYKIRELTKAHQGKTIFVRGSDNNRQRGGITPLEQAEVVKVMTKNMVLKIGNREVTLRTNGTTANHYNYHMYETLENFKAEECLSKIRDAVTYGKGIDAIKVIQAAELLGIEIDIDRFLK